MSKLIQISTTVAKRTDAARIAKVLAERKLSACTQIIGPITSVYRWKGKLRKSKEWLCLIKTTQQRYKAIEKTIKEIHPYRLPEIIAVSIVKGSSEYLEWMSREV